MTGIGNRLKRLVVGALLLPQLFACNVRQQSSGEGKNVQVNFKSGGEANQSSINWRFHISINTGIPGRPGEEAVSKAERDIDKMFNSSYGEYLLIKMKDALAGDLDNDKVTIFLAPREGVFMYYDKGSQKVEINSGAFTDVGEKPFF